MKLDTSKILVKFSPITNAIKRYRVTILVVIYVCMYAFLIMRINTLVNSEPSSSLVTDQLKTVQRLNIDKDSIDTILQLEEQNIQVKSLFKQARDNPFTE